MNRQTQSMFILLLSFFALVCNSERERNDILDHTFYYDSHHYQLNHDELIHHQPILMDLDNLHISIINTSPSLSYIVNGDKKFNFSDDTNYESISYLIKTPALSSTKRRTLLNENNYEWIGCYRDTGDRAFSQGPKSYGYTQNKCYTACEGYEYFALQHGSWCSCENDFSRVIKYGKSTACSAAHTGGAWANDVFKMSPKVTIDPHNWKYVLGILDAKKQLFSSSFPKTGTENANDPKAPTFSVLGTLNPDTYKDEKDQKYTFKLVYGYPDLTRDTIIWKQSSWPTTTDTPQGFEAISVPNQRQNCGTFVGLGLSGSRKHTYLDGNGKGGCWWNSVGTMRTHRGGIPGFNYKIASSEKLYVHAPLSNTIKLLKEKMEEERKKREGLSKKQKKEMEQLEKTVREQGLLHKKHLSDLTKKQRGELSRLQKLMRKNEASHKKRMSQMSGRMRKDAEQTRKHISSMMQKHGESQREHIKDVKREILKEMRRSFEKNNHQTDVLQKINKIKHQQSDLQLRHQLFESEQQQRKELERQTNALTQTQIQWQKRRQKARQKQRREAKELLREQHKIRMKEQDQLLNGLKGFLMAFNSLAQHHLGPHPELETLQRLVKSAQNPKYSSRDQRRLIIDNHDAFGLNVAQVIKCILDESYGELCVTYDYQNDVFSFDVMVDKEKRDKNVVNEHMMDINDDSFSVDMNQETIRDNAGVGVIGYEAFGDLDHFIVHRYEFNHLSEDIECSDIYNSDILPFKVCLSLDEKQNDVAIYIDVMDDLEINQDKKLNPYIESMKISKFMWMNDRNWDQVIYDNGANHIRKCRSLAIAKLCVDVYEDSMFIVEVKLQMIEP